MSARPVTKALSPRRICFIAKARYQLPLESNELNLKAQRALNSSLGLDVSYLIVQGDQKGVVTEQAAGVTAFYVYRFRSELLNHVWFILASVRLGMKLIREQGVRVVCASEPTAGGLAAFVLRRLTGTPFLLQLQGDLFNLPREVPIIKRALTRKVTTFLSRRADGVRCVSRALMDAAKEAGVPDSRLRLVPSRCDTRQFDPDNRGADRLRIRTELGFTDEERVVLFVGSLSVHKGVSYLLRAIRLLRAEKPMVVAVLLGSGKLGRELRLETRRLGLDKHVRFCSPVPYDQVPSWMAAADVFVLPSLDEGMPRVVLEAMSMRLPVVASAVGGVPELVRTGETGFLIPPADVGALSAAIGTVVEGLENGSEMGARARQVVMDHYSFEEGIAALATLIKSVRDAGLTSNGSAA